MKLGVCRGYKEAEVIAAAGYDYIELYFADLARMDEAEFCEAKKKLAENGLQAETFNGFFPGDMVLLGPNADHEKIKAHAECGMRRAAELGGKVAVLGSGTARRVPEGMTSEEGWEEFKKIAALCGDIALQYGMVIAIEPLNAGETNQVITVADGLRLCRELNHPGVRVLADYFHVYKSGETLDAVREAGDFLVHTHLARAADDRGCPSWADKEACARFFTALKESGYEGRMSLECIYEDFETQIKDVLPMLRELAE